MFSLYTHSTLIPPALPLPIPSVHSQITGSNHPPHSFLWLHHTRWVSFSYFSSFFMQHKQPLAYPSSHILLFRTLISTIIHLESKFVLLDGNRFWFHDIKESIDNGSSTRSLSSATWLQVFSIYHPGSGCGVWGRSGTVFQWNGMLHIYVVLLRDFMYKHNERGRLSMGWISDLLKMEIFSAPTTHNHLPSAKQSSASRHQ